MHPAQGTIVQETVACCGPDYGGMLEVSRALARLANLRLLVAALALPLVKTRFGAAPNMLGDAVRAKDAPAHHSRRRLRVEPGENIVPSVLAPDDDPGHIPLLLRAPRVLLFGIPTSGMARGFHSNP